MTNLPRRLLATAALTLLAAFAAGSTVAAQDSGTDDGPTVTVAPPIDDPSDEVIHSWALAPANIDGAGNRPELNYVADPGTTIDDELTLYNYGNQQLTFRIYASDAFNNDAGEFDILPSDEESVDAGSWVSIPQEFIQLPAGQQVTFPISITVPDAATPGDHAAGIVAASEVASQSADGTRIGVERRTGTRVYLRVNGPTRTELAVEDLSTDYSNAVNPFGGSATVSYRIQNLGNIRVSGTSAASIGGPFGVGEQQSADVEFPELLPGQGFVVTREFDNVPSLGIVRTTVELVATAETTGAAAVTASSTTFAPPIALVLLLLAILFGLLAIRAYQRHRRVADPVVEEQPHDHEPQMA